MVKGGAKDARFCIEGARLGDVFARLERHGRVVIKESKCAIVGAGKKDAIGIDAERVDDRVVCSIVEEGALGKAPGLDVASASRTRGKGEVARVQRKGPDRLFVVRECSERLARGQIPQAHR